MPATGNVQTKKKRGDEIGRGRDLDGDGGIDRFYGTTNNCERFLAKHRSGGREMKHESGFALTNPEKREKTNTHTQK